jgi:uncharacterized protein (TIGR02217 family)
MSNEVFPTLPGLEWDEQRIIIPPKVEIRTTPSEREFRARNASLPRYRYTLRYEFLFSDVRAHLQTLVGFYNRHGGPFDSWRYLDKDDNTASVQQFGVGNGAQTSFQLTRSFGGFAEPVTEVASVAIYVDGIQKTTGVSVSAAGVVTFTVAPSVGAVLQWNGTFYRRCRFDGDRLETAKFMNALFNARKVEFISVKELPL